MKKIKLILIFMLICMKGFSQDNRSAFTGTWVYENNDTIFKIQLKNGTLSYRNNTGYEEVIFGGYSLSVNNNIIEDYIKDTPNKINDMSKAPLSDIFILGRCYAPNYVGFIFYDQRIKHLDNTGIIGGGMRLLSPNTLHWTLDEEYGIWHATEGEFDGEHEFKDNTLKGFSVPIDVIMTKIEDDDSEDSSTPRPLHPL